MLSLNTWKVLRIYNTSVGNKRRRMNVLVGWKENMNITLN